jgi:hypothetical protein
VCSYRMNGVLLRDKRCAFTGVLKNKRISKNHPR